MSKHSILTLGLVAVDLVLRGKQRRGFVFRGARNRTGRLLMSMTLMLSPIRVDAEQCGTARGGSGVDEMMMRERMRMRACDR